MLFTFKTRFILDISLYNQYLAYI